jgi:hypothetical protein
MTILAKTWLVSMRPLAVAATVARTSSEMLTGVAETGREILSSPTLKADASINGSVA